MTNKFLEKIASTSVQNYKNKTTDVALAKRNTIHSLVGNVFAPIGTVVNAADSYSKGRDTTGALRELGRAGVEGTVKGVGYGVGGAAVGGALGALGGRKGAQVGAAVGYLGGAMYGGIKGHHDGRLNSIRNQIREGRLANVTDTGHKKAAGLLDSGVKRMAAGATVGGALGAVSAPKDNKISGAFAGAAAGGAVGALMGKVNKKVSFGKSKALTDGTVHKMHNPELIDRTGNVLNARQLKSV